MHSQIRSGLSSPPLQSSICSPVWSFQMDSGGPPPCPSIHWEYNPLRESINRQAQHLRTFFAALPSFQLDFVQDWHPDNNLPPTLCYWWCNKWQIHCPHLSKSAFYWNPKGTGIAFWGYRRYPLCHCRQTQWALTNFVQCYWVYHFWKEKQGTATYGTRHQTRGTKNP